MDLLLLTAFIGIVATLGMTSFLWIITHLRIVDVDMVKAIGSIFTRSPENAFVPGLIIHFGAGIIFSFVYAYFLQIPEIHTLFGYTGAGMLLGFIHGFVTSFSLVVLVAEHHPVKRFQRAGFWVAVFHALAHIIYGLIVGWMVGYYALS